MAKIVIIDDHPSTRDGLSIRVKLEPDLHVCGDADSVEEGLKVIAETNPDLAIVDISLKSSNGIDLIKQVTRDHPAVKTLVWSMYDDSLYAERAMRAGAKGFINKQHVTEKIILAIRQILRGETYFDSDLPESLRQRLATGNLRRSVHSLSDRELQTFQLIGLGHNTTSIAEKMGVSPKTVETYRARIKDKLEINDMVELTREALMWVLENG